MEIRRRRKKNLTDSNRRANYQGEISKDNCTLTVITNKLIEENKAKQQTSYQQLNLFTDYKKQAVEGATAKDRNEQIGDHKA